MFLERMVQINRIKTNDADKAQAELTKFHSSIVLEGLTRIKNVHKLNDRFDKFYIEDISLKGELENVVVMICVWVTGKLLLKGVSGSSIIIIIRT